MTRCGRLVSSSFAHCYAEAEDGQPDEDHLNHDHAGPPITPTDRVDRSPCRDRTDSIRVESAGGCHYPNGPSEDLTAGFEPA